MQFNFTILIFDGFCKSIFLKLFDVLAHTSSLVSFFLCFLFHVLTIPQLFDTSARVECWFMVSKRLIRSYFYSLLYCCRCRSIFLIILINRLTNSCVLPFLIDSHNPYPVRRSLKTSNRSGSKALVPMSASILTVSQ